MKCISCGNEIPDTSTVCPFCGKDVKPLSEGAVPTYAAQGEQDFNANPLVQQEDLQLNSAPAVEMPVAPSQGLENPSVNNAVAPSPSDVAIPPVPGSETTNEPVKPEMSMTPPVVSATSGVMTNPTAPEAATISNQGEMMDGVRESSSTIVAEDKKKAKNKKVGKIIAIVLVLLVLVGGGGFGYAYYSQTQTASKRINTIIDQAIKFDNNINQTFKIASGKYSLNGSITAQGQTISTSLSGIYAYDIEKKIVDYTLNLEQLDMGDVKLIDKEALNIELYYADSNMYVLLQNFYDKYIYSPVTGVDEILDNVGKNEVNSFTILNGFKAAMKAGINAASNKQTAKDIEIGSTKTKANVITIVLNDKNQKAMAEAFLRNLANNQALLDEVAKASEDVTSDKLKEDLEKEIEELKIEEVKDPVTLEIYTAMFGDDFYGIRMSRTVDSKLEKMELYPVTDGYKYIFTQDKNEIINLTLTKKTQKTKDETETVYGIDAIFAESEEVVKFKFEFKDTRDVNPKVERVNTKESIKVENMTEADINGIMQKISDFGNLGLMFQQAMGSIGGMIGGNSYDPTIPDYGTY